ncbi:MAG: coenzyme F420-0:L-glutamate ligase, partial [Bryobacteraceae bacterium]
MVVKNVKLTALAGLPLVKAGDDLGALLIAALRQMQIELQNKDVLVVAQKVVSKAEGRFVDLKTVLPSPRAHALSLEVNKDPRLVEVILSESQEVLRQRRDVLIVVHRLGFITANAGVDQSNVAGED